MQISKILTPQVRTFLYGTIAALLSVATVQGWVSNDLAKSITDNLPTIIGALGSIIAAANVTHKPTVIIDPAAPSPDVAEKIIAKRADIAPVSIGIAQTPAVELPVTK